jgi:hypothetical protein
MRLQIQIAPPLWNRLCSLAHQEHRLPRQQIEFLLDKILRDNQDPTSPEPTSCDCLTKTSTYPAPHAQEHCNAGA